MRYLQARANSCNARLILITRDEQVSASSPLVGSPFCLQSRLVGGRKALGSAYGLFDTASFKAAWRDSKVCLHPPSDRGAWQLSVAGSSHRQLHASTVSTEMLISDGDCGCRLGGALDGDALLLRT